MNILNRYLFLLTFIFVNLEANMIHQNNVLAEEWVEENLNPFDELMISWNALRPEEGKFHFFVSIKTDEWSPWLQYATWGSDGQTSFQSTSEEASVQVYQDAVEVLEGKKATGFKIQIIPEDCSLDHIYGVHVYTNSDRSIDPQETDVIFNSIYLDVSGLSQMTLDHPRHKDLCSPTSTTAVTRFLSNDSSIDPVSFAKQVWDSGFDIYGNWVFNVAQASTYLGEGWNCWVERLNGFNTIYNHLEQGNPVIVSVRGPLPGSAQPYAKGHLLVVIGYDSINQSVLCMDPAFSTDHETIVSYTLSDFVQAWNRRGNVAYIFTQTT